MVYSSENGNEVITSMKQTVIDISNTSITGGSYVYPDINTVITFTFNVDSILDNETMDDLQNATQVLINDINTIYYNKIEKK